MSNAYVITLLSNVFVFYQVMYVWTYNNKRFINIDLRSDIHVHDVKFWNENFGS